MQVFHSIDSAKGASGLSVALGNFDGVHKGHQALIREARAHGNAAVLTFEPHPSLVLQPDMAPRLLTSLSRKLELFSEFGIERAVVQPFTRDYAATSAEAFENALLDVLGARHVVVGHDFTYGTKRSGTVPTLERACAARGAALHVVSPVTVDGLVVSSTKIREYLLAGRVEPATRLLGRPFDVDGLVVRGMARGRLLGFPTANLRIAPELLIPATGIYAVEAEVEGTWHLAAASIGFNPTFGNEALSVEVFLLDFDGDLYDRKLRVRFLRRLREEKRFDSQEALIRQMEKDVAAVREVGGSATPDAP